jgi:hypothetical protein
VGEILSIAKRGNFATNTPEMALIDATQELASGELQCDKLLIIGLDTRDESYSIRSYNSGLRNSEILALCEAVKADTLRRMGY